MKNGTCLKRKFLNLGHKKGIHTKLHPLPRPPCNSPSPPPPGCYITLITTDVTTMYPPLSTPQVLVENWPSSTFFSSYFVRSRCAFQHHIFYLSLLLICLFFLAFRDLSHNRLENLTSSCFRGMMKLTVL